MNKKKEVSHLHIFHEAVFFHWGNIFYSFGYGVKSFFRACKYAWQRITRGYSIWDEWDLEYFYLHLIIDSLKSFRKNCDCYPDGITFEEWMEIIDKMINLFEIAVDDKEEESNKLCAYYNSIDPSSIEEKEKAKQEWVSFLSKVNEERDEARREAFELLSQWLPDLTW